MATAGTVPTPTLGSQVALSGGKAPSGRDRACTSQPTSGRQSGGYHHQDDTTAKPTHGAAAQA